MKKFYRKESTMKKGIIIYQSKYGSAKKYAQWLQNMTDFDCVEIAKAAADEAAQYDTVIFCGGIYASGIAGLSFLKKNFDKFRSKKMAVLCVGASPYDESALAEIKERNLTGDLKNVPLFYGRGAWNESKMKFLDRTLCKMLEKSIANKDPSTYEPWMKALMCAKGQNCDWTDKKYLAPLAEYLEKN